jgi:hypothetical protein
MKVIYEGTIGSYSFQLTDENIIEVWGFDSERPESFIFVKEGDIKTKKDFDTEISYWHIQNVG